MKITYEQSKEYLGQFDDFIIKYGAVIRESEINIENFLKKWIHDIGYNNEVADYFIEEIISSDGVAVLLVLMIILYVILRRRD